MPAFLKNKHRALWIGALGLVLLPLVFQAIGLTLDSATVVVILAMAAMGLNLLVGYTGLVSFGHAAWFGIGGYAAGLAQLHWFKNQMLMPSEGASSGFTPTARKAAPASVRSSHHNTATTTKASTANQAICSATVVTMAGLTSEKMLSTLNMATLALPRIRRFTLYSAVNTRIPASSELMRSFRWINAVHAPTSAPAATAAIVASTG